MGKKDEYRFNLRFDETDEMHRLVVKYLNSCGHNKAKYIVRAFLAYWKMSGKSLLSYVFPEIDAEQLLPEAKQENDKKTAVVAKQVMLKMITGHIYRKIIQSSSCWKRVCRKIIL